jgi:hypothetical protein
MKFVKLKGMGTEVIWVNPEQVSAVFAVNTLNRPQGVHVSAKTMILGAGISLQFPGTVEEILADLEGKVIL